MEQRMLDKLYAVCDYALGGHKNPLMNAELGKDILMEWSRDPNKTEEFRVLCGTLARVGKYGEVKREKHIFQIIEDSSIIDIGEAKELADAYGLKTKEITSAAKSGELINNKWKIERVTC